MEVCHPFRQKRSVRLTHSVHITSDASHLGGHRIFVLSRQPSPSGWHSPAPPLPLSRTQWSYLLNLTSNDKRSGKCRIGSVNGVNGLIITPDDFNQSLPQTISSTDFVNNYQKKGVVFLPAGGHMNYMANVNHSWGFSQEVNGYWTSTPVSGEAFDYRKAYHVSLPNSNSGSPTIAVESMCRSALNNGNRPGKINIRLVQYAN